MDTAAGAGAAGGHLDETELGKELQVVDIEGGPAAEMGVVDHEGQAAVAVETVKINDPLQPPLHRDLHVNRGGGAELDGAAEINAEIQGQVLDVEEIDLEGDRVAAGKPGGGALEEIHDAEHVEIVKTHVAQGQGVVEVLEVAPAHESGAQKIGQGHVHGGGVQQIGKGNGGAGQRARGHQFMGDEIADIEGGAGEIEFTGSKKAHVQDIGQGEAAEVHEAGEVDLIGGAEIGGGHGLSGAGGLVTMVGVPEGDAGAARKQGLELGGGDQAAGEQAAQIQTQAGGEIAQAQKIVAEEVFELHRHATGLQEIAHRDGGAAQGPGGNKMEIFKIAHRHRDPARHRGGVHQPPMGQGGEIEELHPQEVVEDGVLVHGGGGIDGAEIQELGVIHLPQAVEIFEIEIIEVEVEVDGQLQGVGDGIIDRAHPRRQDPGLGKGVDEVLHRVDGGEVDLGEDLLVEGGGEIQHIAQGLVDKGDLGGHEPGAAQTVEPVQGPLDHGDDIGDAEIAEIDETLEILLPETQGRSSGALEDGAAQQDTGLGGAVAATEIHSAEGGEDGEVDIHVIGVGGVGVRGQGELETGGAAITHGRPEIKSDIPLGTVRLADARGQGAEGGT